MGTWKYSAFCTLAGIQEWHNPVMVMLDSGYCQKVVGTLVPTGPLKVSYIAGVMFQSLELPGKSINMEKMTISKLSIKSSCLWALM